jgi:hypothetical protein
VTKKAAFLRLIFATSAVVLSIGVSFRPIPSLGDANDSGRYVANQIQACALPFSGSSSVNHDSSIVLHFAYDTLVAAGDRALSPSMRVWDWLMRPACLGGSPRIFLFYVAMAVPIALLVFANWDHEATLLLALGFLLSTVGFEFMTNALRQGVGLAFLLGAFYFEKRLLIFCSIALAVVIHDSNLVFAPLVVLLLYGTNGLKRKKILLWAIPLLAGAGYFVSMRFLAKYGQLLAAITAVAETYAEKPTVFFLFFMISPMLLIFLLRLLDDRAKATRQEWIVFCYCAAILVLSIAIIPYITYRFAMTAAALQVFMAMKSPNISVRSAGLIACGLIAHFMAYALLSKSVISLLYG